MVVRSFITPLYLSRPVLILDDFQCPECIISLIILSLNMFPASRMPCLSGLCLCKSLKTQLKDHFLWQSLSWTFQAECVPPLGSHSTLRAPLLQQVFDGLQTLLMRLSLWPAEGGLWWQALTNTCWMNERRNEWMNEWKHPSHMKPWELTTVRVWSFFPPRTLLYLQTGTFL